MVLTVARRSPKPKVRVQILIPMPTACSSAGRILRLGRSGRWFESNHADHRASGEDGESHRTVNPALNRLASSNLASPTKSFYQNNLTFLVIYVTVIHINVTERGK